MTFIARITFILLEQKLEFHKKICENKGFHVSYWSLINIENTIKIKNQDQKYYQITIIYAYLESLIERMDWPKNNPEKSFTTNTGEYIPWEHSMFTIWTFDGIKDKYDVYRG